MNCSSSQFSSVLSHILPINVVLTPGCPLPPLSLLLFPIESVVVEEEGVAESVLSPEQTEFYKTVGLSRNFLLD